MTIEDDDALEIAARRRAVELRRQSPELDAAIVRHHHAITVRRIDPHVVVVAARNCGHIGERASAIERS